MLNASHKNLLQLIAARQGMSRTALALASGLSKAAISGMVREMLLAGFLTEGESQAIQGQGRPSIELSLRAEAAYFIGISLFNNGVKIGLINLNGEIIYFSHLSAASSAERGCEIIAAALKRLFSDSGISADRIFGLGVIVSGYVDQQQSSVVQSALLGWRNVPFAAMLRDACGLEVFVENDAKALALSEKLFGHGRTRDNFILLSHGEGIGSASVIAGQLYRGAHGGAGEIAHCTIELEGTPCRCGKRGCLDTLSSLVAIRQLAKQHGLAVGKLAELEILAMQGDSAAIAVIHKAASALGLAIAHLIQLQDPQVILLAHQQPQLDGLFATVLRQATERHVLPASAGATPLIAFPVDDRSWVRAAASVAADRFLTPH